MKKTLIILALFLIFITPVSALYGNRFCDPATQSTDPNDFITYETFEGAGTPAGFSCTIAGKCDFDNTTAFVGSESVSGNTSTTPSTGGINMPTTNKNGVIVYDMFVRINQPNVLQYTIYPDVTKRLGIDASNQFLLVGSSSNYQMGAYVTDVWYKIVLIADYNNGNESAYIYNATDGSLLYSKINWIGGGTPMDLLFNNNPSETIGDNLMVYNTTDASCPLNAGAGVPTIDFINPTPTEQSNLSQTYLPIKVNMTNTSIFSNITIHLYKDNVFLNDSITTINNPWLLNLTNLADGNYKFSAIGYQDDGQNATVGNRTVTLDTIPPKGVTSISSTSSFTWINWTWTNPPDSDFNDSLIYINGTLKTTTTGTDYLYPSFQCGADFNLTIQTRDTFGNINTSLVNNTASTSACKNLDSDLELYYEFNDIDGGPYLDSSGNSHTGQATATPIQTTGRQGFGVGFDGSADMWINSTLNLSTMTGNAFAIQTWINWNSHNSLGDNIFSARDSSGTGLNLYYNASNKSIVLNIYNESNSLCSGTSASTNLNSTGIWNHFIFSYDGIDSGALYLNNSRILNITDCPMSHFSSDLTINRYDTSSGNGFETDGIIDEFAVWNRSLTDSDVNSLWNGGSGRSYAFITGSGVNNGNILFTVGIPSNITMSFTYNDNTGLITYTWADAALQIDGAYFTTTIYNSTGAYADAQISSSDTSGTLTYNISSIINGGGAVYALAYINDSARIYISDGTITVGDLFIAPTPAIPDVIPDKDGGMYALLILIFLLCFGLLIGSATVVLLLLAVGMIFTSIIFLKISMAFVITLIFMIIIILWMVSKTR